MKQENQGKILLYFNEAAAKKEIDLLKMCHKQLQQVITSFCSLGDKISLALNELKTLCIQRKALVIANNDQIKFLLTKKLFPGKEINGVPLRQETVDKLFTLPPINEVSEWIEKLNPETFKFINQNFFEFKNNKLGITEGAEDQIIESFKIYAESQLEKKRLEEAQSLAKALNRICHLLLDDHNNKIESIGDLEMILEHSDGGFIPNPDFIKLGLVGQYMSVLDINKHSKTEIEKTSFPDFSEEFLKTMGLEQK